MREHSQRSTHQQSHLPYLYEIYKCNLMKLNISPTEEELKIHHQITRTWENTNEQNDMQKIDNWLAKIYYANESLRKYPQDALFQYLQELWLKHIAGKVYASKKNSTIFKKSIFSPYRQYNFIQKIKFKLSKFYHSI